MKSALEKSIEAASTQRQLVHIILRFIHEDLGAHSSTSASSAVKQRMHIFRTARWEGLIAMRAIIASRGQNRSTITLGLPNYRLRKHIGESTYKLTTNLSENKSLSNGWMSIAPVTGLTPRWLSIQYRKFLYFRFDKAGRD